jgi:hypothetical protein
MAQHGKPSPWGDRALVVLCLALLTCLVCGGVLSLAVIL